MRRPLVCSLLVATTLLGCPEEPAGGFHEVRFPEGFLWGTATAQWQIEGDEGVNGPVDSNWSRWLALGKGEGAQQNADGNGFFRHYEADAARAKALGLSHFRLSIDWSRVEPEPGVYDDAELDHLVDVLDALRAEGVEPALTLWHWVVPVWVQSADASAPFGRVDLMTDPSEREALLERWEAFVRRVVARVKDRVDLYTVLNEPFSMISAGYLGGIFPPGHLLDITGATEMGITLLFMQARAYDVIKELDDVDADGDASTGDSFVGLTQTANAFYPEDPGDEHLRFAAQQQSYVFNHWLMRALVTGELDVDLDRKTDNPVSNPPEGYYEELHGRLDFVGVQYYGPVVVRRDPLLEDVHPLYARPLLDVREYDETLPHNGMGREISAAGFKDTLWLYATWGVPILLTENGTTTNLPPLEVTEGDGGVSDGGVADSGLPEGAHEPGPFAPEQAAMYLAEHLWEVGNALEAGLDIRGYFHWTLADNFEWVEGQRQRFGAYSVDFADPERPRTLNPMGEALRDIVVENGVSEDIWQRWVLERYPSDTRASSPGGTTSEPVRR